MVHLRIAKVNPFPPIDETSTCACTTVLSVRLQIQSTFPTKSAAAMSTSARVLIPVSTISNPYLSDTFLYSLMVLTEFASLVV